MKEKRDLDGLFRATRGGWCIGDGRERRYLDRDRSGFCAQCACVYACVLFSRQVPFFGLFFIKLASDFIYIYTHTYRINGYFYYLHYGSLITSIYREHCFFKVKGKNDINYSRLNETCLLSTCACDRTYVSKTSILHRTFAAAHVLCC